MKIYNKTIFLVGIMGAGKTRIGRVLAPLLDLPFVDSDQEAERAAHYSIPEIFEKYGEPAFRQLERDVILRLLSGAPCVLASGGGGFMHQEVRKYSKQKAISVWLKADIDILVKRLSRSKHRPMLADVDIGEKIEQLLKERGPAYEEADITIVTGAQRPQNSARLIKAELDRRTIRS